jgi:hypothetical protein
MSIATVELLCKHSSAGREMVASHAMAVPLLRKMLLMKPKRIICRENSSFHSCCCNEDDDDDDEFGRDHRAYDLFVGGECACGVLLAMAKDSLKVQEEILELAIAPLLLLLLQKSQSASAPSSSSAIAIAACFTGRRAKQKAIDLLKLLHSNWPHHPCIAHIFSYSIATTII